MQRPVESSSWPRGLSSLSHLGYRVFLLGQAISLQGTWVQGTAQRWLVLELTGSPFYVGMLGAVAGLPILFFSLAGGVLADRIPKISFLIMVHVLILLQALVFGLLIQTGLITFPAILGLALLLGTGMAFEVPARQSLIFDLVGKDDITNGIAMHSAAFNLARFGGPALAGILMQAGYMAGCFYFKALSSLAIIASLVFVRARYKQFDSPPLKANETSPVSAVKEVIGFIGKKPLLSSLLLTIMAFGILLLPYSILLPSLGKDLLGLNARDYGFICAANGLGALGGAVFVATFGHGGNRISWWRAGAVLFPISLIVVALSQDFLQVSLALFASGFIMVVTSTSAMSLLQIHSINRLRGRIMGLFTTCFMGLFPFGSLLQGWLAHEIGIRQTMILTALLALLASMTLAIRVRQ